MSSKSGSTTTCEVALLRCLTLLVILPCGVVAGSPLSVRAAPVLVRFDSEPSGAKVLISGQDTCAATPCGVSLEPGPQRVEMRLAGFATEKMEIRVAAGMDPVILVLKPDLATVDLTVSAGPRPRLVLRIWRQEDLDPRAERKRQQTYQSLNAAWSTAADGELMFRLAKMYAVSATFQFSAALDAWTVELERWDGNNDPPFLPAVDGYQKARTYQRLATELFEKVLAKYPRYPRNDETLFLLGSMLYAAGDTKGGVKVHWKLIKQYPTSRRASRAWLLLGEHFFALGKLRQAMKAYTKAAEKKEPRVYLYALYKLAWCDWAEGDVAKAEEKLRLILALPKTAPQVRNVIEKELVELRSPAAGPSVSTRTDALLRAQRLYLAAARRDKEALQAGRAWLLDPHPVVRRAAQFAVKRLSREKPQGVVLFDLEQ
ncbi:PEGA domain-containing protein [Myxococcota bacterium]